MGENEAMMIGATFFNLLAQVTTTPATEPVIPPVIPSPPWTFDGAMLGRAGMIAGIVLVVGVILLILLRKLIIRAKLRVAATFLLLAIAGYVFIYNAAPVQMRIGADPLNPNGQPDPIAWWIHRGFAAVFVIIGLRFLDRLVIVPILSRGGTLPVSRLLHQIINTVIAVFAILAYGSRAFGWDINQFLAGSAVVSIVLGLALQESLGNFFSGLVMQGSPPFKLGDWIVCGNYQGRVVDMNWRAVTIHTDDGNHVMIPNANIAKSELINHNAPSAATRRTIRIGMEYDNPPCDVIDCLNAAARETQGVIADPPPDTLVANYGSSSLDYDCRFWIDNPKEHLLIEHRVRQNAWYRLRERGLTISFSTTIDVSNLDERQKQARVLKLKAREHAIGRVPLLAPLTHEQRAKLADEAAEILLSPGQVLFKQGDPGETFYIIFHGKVEVLIDVGGQQKVVATLSPGDFFGEMAALTGQPRRATIRAVEHLKLVEISKMDLHGIFAADPSILEKISGVIAQRDAEREAASKTNQAPPPAVVAAQKKSLLTRMIGWFGL
jgi:small-conductance mechanosensitive channel/CRP-like cAMP-binding protein